MSEERDLGRDKCQHKCQHQQDLLQWGPACGGAMGGDREHCPGAVGLAVEWVPGVVLSRGF